MRTPWHPYETRGRVPPTQLTKISVKGTLWSDEYHERVVLSLDSPRYDCWTIAYREAWQITHEVAGARGLNRGH